MLRIALAFLLLLAPVSAPAKSGEPLFIHTGKGRVTFSVEIANTPESRTIGLMHRRDMPADSGMLFDFIQSAPVSMWMKDTLIPLDMLFIRSDGIITNIAQRTVPRSTVPINSTGPVLGVLELNGGTCARLDIKPGDRIIHPIFQVKP